MKDGGGDEGEGKSSGIPGSATWLGHGKHLQENCTSLWICVRFGDELETTPSGGMKR